jgi:hypothetical protein
MNLVAQYMKTRPDALGIAETRPRAQNLKMEPDALATAENVSGGAKHENGTRLPRNHRKRVRERKT